MADTDYDESGSEGGMDSGKKQRRSAAGRKLMRWNPDLDQFVLLAVDIVCSEQGAPIPWNLVAAKLSDHLTGEGIKQHLAKLRKFREEDGRKVPQRTSKGRKAAAAYGPGTTNTPQRTPKKRNIGDDIGAVTGKGAGLLWTDPNKKAPKPPKESKEAKEIKAPKVQKSKEVRKNVEGGDAALATPKTPGKKSRKSNAKVEESDDEKVVSKKKSTGKRSRGKETVIKEEFNDDHFQNDSPTKKQRSLRPTHYVDYDDSKNADDEFGEDIFEARSQGEIDDEVDGDYDDGFYGSQPNTGSNSKNASSHSSQKGTITPTQAPPNFEGMLHSRTGMYSYGEDFMGDGHGSNFGGPFTGLNNSYGPGGVSGGYGMDRNGGGMMVDHGSQFGGPLQLTADQMQMQNEHGGYANSLYLHGHPGDSATPVRKAMKQGSRDDDGDREGTATPLGKKSKKKSQDLSKQTPKSKSGRKSRKDSAHPSDGSSEMPNGFFANDHFGNIPIANDTGRGLGNAFGGGMPNFSLPLMTHDHQHGPTLTTSPTDIGDNNHFMGGLPAMTSSDDNFGATGITPHFNNFTFGGGDVYSNGNDAVPRTTFNGGFPNVGSFDGTFADMNDLTQVNTSFSSSNDTSRTGSQGDITFPPMDFSAVTGTAAGLGLGDAWMPSMGTGMEIEMGGEDDGNVQDHDMFSMLNHDGYH